MAEEKQKYHVLTPKTDLADSVYFEAMDIALKDQSVHNLAVAGPYGAGKSSVIHSYINRRKKEKNVIGGEWPINDITVTLGHLCVGDDEEGVVLEDSTSGTKPYRHKKEKIDPNLIEYSILEQLFFHASGANLPESQFSRIKPISRWDIMVYVFYIVFFGACVFAWFYRNTLGLDFSGYLALIIFSVLSSYAVYKLLPIIRSYTVRKISLATASIEIGKGKEQSVLNKHIDEILYFFQQTGTNFVVFEDLDRFNNPDLFVKLREINYLINNAVNIEQQVVFVYALRDDIFRNRQRTKFFDFIVPIIPYVDGKNAADKLYEALQDGGIDDRLCEVLSFHVREMRMVYNIVNEYHVYVALKNKEAEYNANELLAIVAYKNCYPKDFAALMEHQGLLYDVMTKKDMVVAAEKDRVRKELSKLEEEVKQIQHHQQTSIKALRLEYINSLLKKMPKNTARLGAFVDTWSLDDWAEDVLFEGIRSKTAINYVYQQPRTSNFMQGTFNYKFSDIEKTVDPIYTYSERVKFIQDRHRLESLQREIGKLRAIDSYTEESKYLTLLSEGYSVKDKFDYKNYQQFVVSKEVFDGQIELIDDLLSFDFINEDYQEYVSLFHPVTLGYKDQRFLIDVLRHKHNPYTYPLEKPEKVVEKMEKNLFLETSAWWNFMLVDALLRSEASHEKIENMARCLSDTDGCNEFINEYVYRGEEADRLVSEICAVNDEIWRSLVNNTTGLKIDKDYWAKLIIRNASIEQIQRIFDKNEPVIADMEDYFHMPDVDIKKLYDIAKSLEIKFTSIDYAEDAMNKEFMLQNEAYSISPTMLRCVLSLSAEDEWQFTTANYTYLRSANKKELIAYIEGHLEEYVNEVLLTMPTNTQEEIIHLSAILADERVSEGAKGRLIKQNETIWEAVDQCDKLTPEIEQMLYAYNRVKVTWKNVLHLYELDKEIFASYIGQKNVVDELKSIGAPDMPSDREEKWKEMQCEIIQRPALKSTVLALIDCFDVECEQWMLVNCDKNTLALLIEKGRIAKRVSEFQLINGVSREMGMQFFMDNYSKFAAYIPEMHFDEYDIRSIFSNEYESKLTDEQKLHILENIDAEMYVTKYNFNEITGFLIQLEIKADDVSQGVKTVVKALLILENEPALKRIELFNKYPVYVDTDDINSMLSTFGSEYYDGKHISYRIPSNPITLKFCKTLVKVGYLDRYTNFGRTKKKITVIVK